MDSFGEVGNLDAPPVFDVWINIYSDTGRVVKNTTESHWKKLSLLGRYEIGAAADYNITGIAIYRGAVGAPVIQNGAVIGISIESYNNRQIYPIFNSTDVSDLCDSIYERKSYYQLRDALVLKTEGWTIHPLDVLAGAITTPDKVDLTAALINSIGGKRYNETWQQYQLRTRHRGTLGKVYEEPEEPEQRQGEPEREINADRQGAVLGTMASLGVSAYTAIRLDNLMDKVEKPLDTISRGVEQHGEAIGNNLDKVLGNLATGTDNIGSIVDTWTKAVDVAKVGAGDWFTPSIHDKILSIGLILQDLYDGSWRIPNVAMGSCKLLMRLVAGLGITGKISRFVVNITRKGYEKLFTFIAQQFYTARNGEETERRQGFSSSCKEIIDGAKEMVEAIITTIYTVVTNKLPTAASMKSIMSGIKDINALMAFRRNIGDFISGLISTCNRLLQFVMSYVYPQFGLYLRCMTGGDVKEWFGEATDLLDQLTTDEHSFYKSVDVQEKVRTTFAAGREFLKDALLNASLQKTAIGTAIQATMRSLQPFYDKVLLWRGLGMEKPIPYGVYLYGKPGIGKSTVVSNIVDLLVDPSVPKLNRTYSRNVQEKYWSGYRHQVAVVMDDVGNFTDGVDSEDIMKIFSPVPLGLEMAAIEEKNTQFTSKLVVMTSNTAFPKSSKIVDLLALWRRRDYAVEMGMYRDDNVPADKRERPARSEFNSDMSHAWFRRFKTDVRENGQLIYLTERMDYESFMRDLALDYTKSLTAKPAEKDREAILEEIRTRVIGPNAIRQSGRYSPYKLDFNEGAYFFTNGSDDKYVDPRTGEEVDGEVQWRQCCPTCTCPIPRFHVVHRHETHSFKRWNGTQFERRENADVVIAEFPLDSSWEVIYDKVTPREIDGDLPTEDGSHYYVRNMNPIVTTGAGFFEKAFAKWQVKSFLKQNAYTIYFCIATVVTVGQLVAAMWLSYPRKDDKIKEDTIKKRAEMDVRESSDKPDTKQRGPNYRTPKYDIEERMRNMSGRQSEVVDRIEEMTRYTGNDDLMALQTECDAETDRISQEKWLFYREMLGHVENFFRHVVVETMNGDTDAHLVKAFNNQGVLQSDCSFSRRYRRFLGTLEELKATEIGDNNFDAVYASLCADRDHILMVVALLGYKGVIDLWQSIMVDYRPRYNSNVSFVNRVRRLLMGGIDFVKIYDKTTGIEKALALLTGRKRTIDIPKNDGIPTEVKQSESDPNADDLVSRMVKSMVIIRVESEGATPENPYVQHVNGVGVRGQFIIAPAHVFCGRDGKILGMGHKEDCRCGFRGHEHKVTIRAAWSTDTPLCDVIFNPTNVEVMRTAYGDGFADMVIFYAGPRMPALKDNRAHFLSGKDMERLIRYSASLVTLRPVGSFVSATIIPTEVAPLTKVVSYSLEDLERADEQVKMFHDIKEMNGWEYQANTISGDCGGIIIARSTKMTRKLVGIHVSAGRAAGTSYGEVVTIERIDEALEKLMKRNKLTNAVREGLVELARLDDVPEKATIPEGNFTIMGSLKPGEAPRRAEKTGLRKSVIHGEVYEPQCEPAILSSKDPRIPEYGLPKGYSALWSGVKKFGQRTEEFHPEHMALVKDYIKGILFHHMDDLAKVRRVCSENEAINGNDAFGWESMDMDTSPGFQWTKDRRVGDVGKRHLFDGEPGQYRVKVPELRNTLDQMESEMRDGMMTKNLWTCTLKDEKREKWKVKLGKTRVFIAAPVTYTMLCRKYTLAFSSSFIRCRLKIPSAVGINTFSTEWNEMISKLTEISEHAFAGDFGNWDGHMHPEIIDAICDMVNEWYGDSDEDQKARKVLFAEMVHNMEVANNIVFYKHYGNPSGNPLTTVVNTIGNMMYFALAWLDLAPLKYRDLSFYEAWVRVYFFGDDHLGTVAEPARIFYTMKALERWFRRIGHDYTPPEKNKVHDKEFGVVYDEMFLKCKSVKIGGMWWPKMERATITEMVNWVRDCPDHYIATVKNCSDALRFLYFYGEETFNEERDRLQAALDKYARSQKMVRRQTLPTYMLFNECFGKEKLVPYLQYDMSGLFGLATDALGRKTTSVEKEAVRSMSDRQSKVGPTTDNTEPRAMHMEPNEETSEGIIRANQTEPERVKAEAAFTRSNLARGHMSDNLWDLKRLVERPTLVTTLGWTTSNAQGALVWQKAVPLDLLIPEAINHVPFDWFHLWRGKVIVTFQVNGTQWHSGRLAIVWVPLLSKAQAATYYADNLSAVTATHHGELDPSVSNIVEMELDFSHPRDFIRPTVNDVRGQEQLGTLNIFVLSALRCGDTVPQLVNVSVHVQFVENDFVILRGKDSASRKTNAVRQGNVFTYNNNFKSARDVTVGQRAESDLFGSGMAAGASMHLDKPNCGLEPVATTMNTMGYMSNSENIPFAERLSLQAGAVMRVKPEHFGTKKDEMDMVTMRQTYGLEKSIMWSTSQTSGTILTKAFICPCSKILENKLRYAGTPRPNTDPGDPIMVTPLDFFSIKNTYWKGGIKIKIVVVASAYHVGKLFLGLDYQDVEVPLTLLGATSEYGVYIDINEGRHEFEYKIKYQSDTPAKRVPNGPKGGFGGEENLKFATGVWSLRVVNELVQPGDASSEVEVMIYLAADDDYRTYGLDFNNRVVHSISPSKVFPTLNAVRQSGEAISAVDRPATTDNFGEKCDHVNDILKRFCLAFEVTGSNEPPGWTFNIAYLFNGNTTMNNDPHYGTACGLWAYYGAGYLAQRGTMRFKINHIVTKADDGQRTNGFWATFCPLGWDNSTYSGIFNPTNISTTALSWNLTSGNPQANAPAFSFGNGTMNSALQVEVPYQGRYNFSRKHPVADQQDGMDDEYTMGTLVIGTAYPVGSIKGYTVQVYMASGDELRFGLWLGPPKIFVAAPYNNLSQWPDTYY